MKGSTTKRCGCPPEHDSRGRRKACPKKHGSWSYVVDVGTDPVTGKRKQLRKSGFRTQAEAATAMAEVMGQVDQGRFRHDRRQTVRQYLEQWLKDKHDQLRPTTRTSYRAGVTAVLPHIGHLRLRDLQTNHLTKAYREINAANAARGVGPVTVEKAHVAVRSALSDARREGLIPINPATDAVVPRATKRKVNPWGGADLGTFLDQTASHPLGPVFELIALTGLRRGEVMGLRWEDVYLGAGYVVIRQQLVAVATSEVDDPYCPYCGVIHKGMVFGPPKTANGEARRVDLGQAGVGVLLAQKLAQDAQRAEWGDAYVDHDLVFAAPDGNPIRPDFVTKTFGALVATIRTGCRSCAARPEDCATATVDTAPCCPKCDHTLRGIRLHDLRHGRASLLLAAGVDIAVVSKVLGHSTIRITSDTYSHLLEGVGKQAAEAADSLIVRQIRDQSVTNEGGDMAASPSG